jgi:hypothetical protein
MSWVALSEETGCELDNQSLMYTRVFLFATMPNLDLGSIGPSM